VARHGTGSCRTISQCRRAAAAAAAMLTSTRSSITSSGNVTKVSRPDLSPVQNFGLGFGPNLEGSVSVSVSISNVSAPSQDQKSSLVFDLKA